MFDVRVEDTADSEIVGVARHLLDHALAADLRDDRFSDSWVREINSPTHTFIASVATGDAHPVGFVGGTVESGRLQLDALVSPHSRWDQAEVFDALLRSILEPALSPIAVRVDSVEVWGKPAYDWHASVLHAHGFEQVRALQQMRCALPVAADAIPTRSFRPGHDDDALIRVNNRAFVDHPDQGGWTLETLQQRMAEPWFDPDGVRLFERDGQLAGFCWTKIHQQPPLGEIFAIGIDPDFHGQRLGVPMTAAGLAWLHDQGLAEGMLYVECDNTPAVRTYERLGFSTVRIDRAWHKDR